MPTHNQRHRIEHVNDDLPPDLSRLRVLETWLVLSLARVQQRIADVERREAERRVGEQRRPPRPDWIIDMGPEGGVKGGEIVAVGTPEAVAKEPRSFTGRYLAPLLAT